MIIYSGIINEITGLPHSETYKIVFSVTKTDAQKAVIKPIILKKTKAWQCEKFINGASFHENIGESCFRAYLERLLDENQYRQINVIASGSVTTYRISKNNEIHKKKTADKTNVRVSLSHDKPKEYILTEGMPVLPLVDLGVFTEDFHVVKAKYSKFRQINSFLKIIDSGLRLQTDAEDRQDGRTFTIAEFGCGKSYLTFMLYYYFTAVKKINVKITGYDINGEIIDYCNGIAQKYKYENLEFIKGDISEMTAGSEKTDMLVTLHACDTATDHALFYAVQNGIKYIFSVPCCQHEINAQIKHLGEYAPLLKYGLIKERFSALLTDSIRCELLSGAGYTVDIVEFVGEENTPKNIMIRGRYTGHKKDNLGEIQKLLSQFGADQTLFKLMNN